MHTFSFLLLGLLSAIAPRPLAFPLFNFIYTIRSMHACNGYLFIIFFLRWQPLILLFLTHILELRPLLQHAIDSGDADKGEGTFVTSLVAFSSSSRSYFTFCTCVWFNALWLNGNCTQVFSCFFFHLLIVSYLHTCVCIHAILLLAFVRSFSLSSFCLFMHMCMFPRVIVIIGICTQFFSSSRNNIYCIY